MAGAGVGSIAALLIASATIAAAFQPTSVGTFSSLRHRSSLSLRPGRVHSARFSSPAKFSRNALSPFQMSVFQGISAKDIDGQMVQLEQVSKKVTLVTNVACFCGFTKQYPGFQELQKKFGDRFTVIAFPCNQFGGQEPGTPAQIKEFVKQFGVTFPIMDKVEVNGPNEHPLYTKLKSAQPGIIPFRKDINWNFTKFLIVDGKCVKRYESITEPAKIAKDIEAYLGASA